MRKEKKKKYYKKMKELFGSFTEIAFIILRLLTEMSRIFESTYMMSQKFSTKFPSPDVGIKIRPQMFSILLVPQRNLLTIYY